MKIKKIEDMDHYEMLDIPRSTSQQEIHQAYQVCKQAYSRSSIAIHGLIDDNEREDILSKIEEAYSILGSPRKRKKYDEEVLQIPSCREEESYFRSSTGKLVIEDGDERKGMFKRLTDFFKRNES
jgi:DnaJ-class molecular chaperone